MASSARPRSSTSGNDIIAAIQSLQQTTLKCDRRVAKLLTEAQGRENVLANTLEEVLADLKTLAASRSAPPVFGHNDEDSSDDDEGRTCKPVLVASTSKSDRQLPQLTQCTIAPLLKLLNTASWRRLIDADLLKLLLKGFTKGDRVTLDPDAATIVAALLRFATRHPHLARTSPVQLTVTETLLAKTAGAVVKAKDKNLSHKNLLKFLAHVRTRFAEQVLQILLHYMAPGTIHGLPDTAPHKNCVKIPETDLAALVPLLAQQRSQHCLSEAFRATIAEYPDYAPPMAVLACSLASTLDTEGGLHFLSPETPVIKTFEELISRLDLAFDSANFHYGLLAYVMCVAQYKMRLVQKKDLKAPNARAKLVFETMPAPKVLAESMLDLVEFMQDIEACPTSYVALRGARGEKMVMEEDNEDDDDDDNRTDVMSGDSGEPAP